MHNNRTSDLLNKDHIKLLFSIFENNDAEIRLVGGCIRDIFLNKQSKDIDAATVIEPNEVLKLLNSNNIEYDDFALQYGSVIAYPLEKKVQITSLREDVNQIGRHTNVIFTKDWQKDAARRDFTFNAMYLGNNNELFDYYNGLEDLREKKIRFIGEIEERIKEDYLRIYRFFRFLGLFELPNITLTDQRIVEKYIHESLSILTNDTIRQEILKMFSTPYTLNCFYNSHQTQIKFKWVEIIKEHFIRTNYELGLNKCLNKIDNIIN
tara:strand:- start:3 stop:797 length:795 start_codon:yes stop_codon:yes gene_type:complete